MSYPLTFAACLLLIALVAGLLCWVATAGNDKAVRRVAAKRAVTPYTPPANSRPRDFDTKGRPW